MKPSRLSEVAVLLPTTVAMTTLAPSAPVDTAPNATGDAEPTNELKSLIEGRFFQTTYTHIYACCQRPLLRPPRAYDASRSKCPSSPTALSPRHPFLFPGVITLLRAPPSFSSHPVPSTFMLTTRSPYPASHCPSRLRPCCGCAQQEGAFGADDDKCWTLTRRRAENLPMQIRD